ncbi:MAG: 23S rRNA (adenine(2030)-N(6))-methyltransferase RlmJ [Steroidobacteraceae bacterium]
MKYRHSFHAGNFADVHKHVALLALLRAMQRKDKGFLYLDTHAGAGCYDLADLSTHHGAEARHGVTALMAAAEPAAAELRDYRAQVAAARAALDGPRIYPGSSLLAARVLRPQDRGLCCELLARECRALERAVGAFPGMRTECGDGFHCLQASLPPALRRSLVLIDPPYENPAEEIGHALTAIAAALARLANAVIALWYPIKDERWLASWQQRIARELSAPAVCLELWLYPRDARVALNGSGLLIVNPPYRFAQCADAWQRELRGLLDGTGLGGSAVRTLIVQKDSLRAGA